jgi:hypothetical protein
MTVRQSLEEARGIVGQVPDGSARERRQARHLGRRPPQGFAQVGQQIAGHSARALGPAHAHAGGVRSMVATGSRPRNE